MSLTEPSHSDPKSFSIFWILLGAMVGWLPLIVHTDYWVEFFYFTNEWDMLHDMDVVGYWKWVFDFRAELFIPVFKFLWTAVVFLGDGNYHMLLLAVFANHVLVLFLLGYLMRLWRFSLTATLFSQCVLGANYTHIELFSWTSQWIGLLALTSFLLIIIPFAKAYLQDEKISWWHCILVLVVSALGALSFGRGVLNGAAVFGACAVLFALRDSAVKHTWMPAIFALVPCVLVAGIIAAWSFSHSENLADSGGQVNAIISFFAYGLALNPWFQQIQGLHISVGLAVWLFILNFGVVALGIFLARSKQRPFLYVLILFFLGDAALIALGRNHMPIETIPSWRYQYFSILVFAPFVGIILHRFIEFIPFQPVRFFVAVAVVSLSTKWVFQPWEKYLPSWSDSRGTQTRLLVDSETTDPADHTISGYDKISNERALELAEKYNLH